MLEVAERSRGLPYRPRAALRTQSAQGAARLIQVGAIGPVLHLELVSRPYVRATGGRRRSTLPGSWCTMPREARHPGRVGSHLIAVPLLDRE